MAYDTTQEAVEVAKAEVKQVGVPTPELEKDAQLGKPTPYVPTAVATTETDDDDDGSHPTEEQIATLRRVPGRLPWLCFVIAFVELCERFAYYGTVAVLTNFIQRPLPPGTTTGADSRKEGRPGALGQGQRAAVGLTTFNRFWAYFMPLIGGWLADTRWGRFKTIQASVGIAMIGHVIIIVSALPPVIKHPNGALGCLAVGIVFFGIGVGGFKPNISPLMVDQLRAGKMKVKTLGSGEQVIVDPAVTTQRAFMYFYLFINTGAIVGQVTMVYAEKYIGFWLSFTLPTIMFIWCPLVLWLVSNRLYKRAPTGSVLGNAMSLIKLACKDKVSLNPVSSVRNIRDPSFWEDVKPSRMANKPSWMIFDDAWVNEVARGCKACTVFIFYPLFWLAYNQVEGNLVSQAATLTLGGIPNDLLTNLNPLSIVILIPIVDQIVYPTLRKLKIRFTPLRRMCAGFFVACAAMIWSAVVQAKIYEKGPCGKYMNTCDIPNAPMTVWVQTGAYILVGLAEIFASITGLEYAYTKAPANMKGLVFGFYHFTSAISAAIGQAFTALSEDPLLVWNYGSVSIIAFFGGCAFWYCFGKWDKQEEEMNELPESSYTGPNYVPQQKVIDDETAPATENKI